MALGPRTFLTSNYFLTRKASSECNKVWLISLWVNEWFQFSLRDSLEGLEEGLDDDHQCHNEIKLFGFHIVSEDLKIFQFQKSAILVVIAFDPHYNIRYGLLPF